MSLRKSSRRRNGSKSDVAPKPNARRRCTPAPSRVGLALTSRFTGRIDIGTSRAEGHPSEFGHQTCRLLIRSFWTISSCCPILLVPNLGAGGEECRIYPWGVDRLGYNGA